MVRYHYALVDDLISREEFDRRIEQKVLECGRLIDETAAAMLVVGDLGRSHVKVRDLRKKTSLFCFFVRILAVSEPAEFERSDGQKGLVARMTVADETGQVDLVFWDEQAAALADTFEIGDVIEVIGKHGKNRRDIMPLNMRKACCEIECNMNPREQKLPERIERDILIICVEEPRLYNRRDGSVGEMIPGLVGDASGTARLVCWEPSLLAGYKTMIPVHLAQGLEREGDFGGRELIIDDTSTLTPPDTMPVIPMTAITDLEPDTTVSLTGTIEHVQPRRSFTRRDGSRSYVRNATLRDSTGQVHLVLWDELAVQPILTGETVELYHLLCRTGRNGENEVSAGRSSYMRVIPATPLGSVEMSGTILVTPTGTFLDNGYQSYLIETSLPQGTRAVISGFTDGTRLFTENEKITVLSADEIKKRLNALIESLDR